MSEKMIKVKVLFFANIKEIIGHNFTNLDIPENTTLQDFKKCPFKRISLNKISH